MLPVLGLVLLLLLSPCRVRNFLQSELGIPQTEVSNKNITTVNSTNCTTLENSETVFSIAKTVTHNLLSLAINNVDFAFDVIHFTTKSASFYFTRNSSVSVVPLYILYQNFKVYL